VGIEGVGVELFGEGFPGEEDENWNEQDRDGTGQSCPSIQNRKAGAHKTLGH
jgi:hypothetical protein